MMSWLFCIAFIQQLLENAMQLQIHFDCIMSVFCTSLFNLFGRRFLSDKITF